MLCVVFCSISMKVDMVVKEANDALKSDKCVVIGIQNTGEVCLTYNTNTTLQLKPASSSDLYFIIEYVQSNQRSSQVWTHNNK